jgi:RNA ligase
MNLIMRYLGETGSDMATIDIEQFRERESQGLITCRTHPTADLLIWNYTPKCQFDRAWDEVTMQARGLITKPDGTIIARSFSKFFNLEEHQGQIPLELFTVTEKMDGSLGILYFIDGKPQIATRGSFTSEQAVKANDILYNKYGGITGLFKPSCTYLFEILYPDNRIVVDYGNTEDLVLLAIVDTKTGHEHDIHNPDFIQLCNGLFPIVKRYDGIKDISELRQLEEPNKEGFVIRFENGLRLKAKFSDYVRLHKLITQCTARTIWDLLRNNQPFDDLMEKVPDEFYTWVKNTRTTLQDQFDTIETDALKIFAQVHKLPTRKEQAAIVCKHAYSAVVFSMLDGKPYGDIIWKQLRPQAELPFREEVEA